MAVIVVGDIDVDAIEAKITEHFGSRTAPEPALAQSFLLPAGLRRHGYLILTDPESLGNDSSDHLPAGGPGPEFGRCVPL